MVECSFTNQVVVGSNPVAFTQTSVNVPVSSKLFLDVQGTIECRFTLKCVSDIILTYSHGPTFLDLFKFNVNSFQVTDPNLYTLKTENLCSSNVFRGYKYESLALNRITEC